MPSLMVTIKIRKMIMVLCSLKTGLRTISNQGLATIPNYNEEENGQYYWELHKKYKEYLKDWETQNFGPDPDDVWVSESNPPKAIEKIHKTKSSKDEN